MNLTNDVENSVVKIEDGINIIDEKRYQQFKKELCKTDDYLTSKEWKILAKKLTLF